MYHCHLHFYLIGPKSNIFNLIQAMPPLDNFSHNFSYSDLPQKDLTTQADVILVNMQGLPARPTLEQILTDKKPQTQLILMVEKEQLPKLTDCLPQINDIWTLPLTEVETKFHFTRWQQNCRQEKEAWQTSQFLEATINSIPNLIWYKTKDGIHEKVNDSFCKTVNKTKQQVQGRGHAYIWDVEQDDPACIESERIVMESGKTCISEETVQTGEGTSLLTTYKTPLYDLDGSVMGTVGVGIDITQEHAYKQELLTKTQNLENLFTTMDCGVLCHTVDGARIISVNPAALKILGYESKEELSASGFDTVAASVLDEDKSTLRQSILGLKNVGDSVSVEYRVHHNNGEILHIMGNVKLMEEHGELFYQRFLLDCTAKKMHELQEQQEKEHRQMALIQALSMDYNLVCFFDLDTCQGSVLRINDCQFQLLETLFQGNLNLQTNMENYIKTCVHPDDQDMLRQAVSPEYLQQELAENNTVYCNYRTLCNSTNLRYFQLKAVRTSTWEKDHGIVLGMRSVDEETRSELEKKNLLQEALQQANRASKAKSVFLSNMSHDIRTPMNAIVGFTSLAITHINQREQVQEYLKKIMTSGNHLLSLINDILDMSRIESGKMNLDEKPCSLPDILHALRNIVQADIHAKHLELYIDAVDVYHEEIFCDKLRLNQILLNLLSNSIKYTGTGGIISVKITEKPGAPTGFANYEFHIKDTGIGMSQDFVEHIFEPFERERNSTISRIQGTGLGMAITKNIVDMMHGGIEVLSQQGVGTEFIVSLTFRLDTNNKEPITIPELKNCRALVVDDDFNTCDSVSYMLQQIGLRAEWTLSGKEAVLRTRQAVSRNDNYSVYIIDWLLPDMNGIEVARRIRKEIGDEVPIIVLTAYDWSDIEEEALEAGVTAFCSKPLFASELRTCLRSVVCPNQNKSTESKPQTVNHTGRILLVEDNELNQEIAEAILLEAAFTVEIAENGQIAVDMLKDSEPGYYRLVLMDIQMPVLNGFKAAKAIRQLENRQLANIPILAMTANAFEEDKQEALRCGMNGHIAKPIDMDMLFETLDKVLE